jgi:hypothetical protein
MTRSAPHLLKWRAPAAAIMLCLLALPSARHFLEASMTRHMLVQFPLVLLSGFWLAGSLPRSWLAPASKWNMHGISGLFATALLLALLMVPRLLDLALVDVRIELAKWLALLVCGTAVRLSWQSAGLVVQGFFLGNVLPMMAVVGYLFGSSPVRVCNAYLLDDQEGLGQKLVWIAAAIGLAWFASVVRQLMREEDLPAPSDKAPGVLASQNCPDA